jgi:hypothetical protein
VKSTTISVAQRIGQDIERAGALDVGAQLSHGSAGTESFEVQATDGKVYRVCVVPIPSNRSSEFRPDAEATQAGPKFKLSVGMRVRSGLQGPTYFRSGEIRQPEMDIHVGQVWILWEGNLMPNGYPWDSEIVRCLQRDCCGCPLNGQDCCCGKSGCPGQD